MSGSFVVGDTRDSGLLCVRVGEGVLNAAQDDQLSVDAAVAHRSLEFEAVLGWDDRVVGADEHQHLAGDICVCLVGRRAGRVCAGWDSTRAPAIRRAGAADSS